MALHDPLAPHTCSAPPARRPKTGGRKKGTPNKSTAGLRDAMLQVFADLQAESGLGYGHLLEWARGNSTDFYKLVSRLLPRQVIVPEPGPGITEIRRMLVSPPAQIIDRPGES